MPVKRPSRKTKSGDVFGQSRRQAKILRAGLYARVSTTDQQTLAMQMRALREYVVRRGWTVVIQVREIGSGAVERKAREQLMEAARRREIDVVLVWRLDRWGRSVTDLLVTLQELEHLSVGFVSLTEALDLTTPAGRAMAGLLAIFADNAECVIMQSRSAELDPWPTCQGRETPHNNGSKRDSISESGDLNRPRRSAIGNTASTASSFSVGSTRR
jgi:hypothetical protein